MGIFDQAPPGYPPAPIQQQGTPPQQPQYPPAPSWPPQPAPVAPPQGFFPPPQQPPPGAYPPAPQGYAPPAYGGPGAPPPAPYPPQAPPPGYGPPAGGGYRSPFDSLTGAKVFGDKAPFWSQGDDGTYAVVVGEVRRFAARKGNVDTYSVEVKVIFSTNPKISPGASRCKQEQASKEGADGRIKKFIMAAGNVPEAGVDDAAYHASYGEQQIFRGTILLAEVNGGTSTNGRPFTNVAYRTPQPDEMKRLAALAQQVDPTWRPAPLQAALLR